jgi:hypothetical protein
VPDANGSLPITVGATDTERAAYVDSGVGHGARREIDPGYDGDVGGVGGGEHVDHTEHVSGVGTHLTEYAGREEVVADVAC